MDVSPYSKGVTSPVDTHGRFRGKSKGTTLHGSTDNSSPPAYESEPLGLEKRPPVRSSIQNPDHFKVIIGRAKENQMGFVRMNPNWRLKVPPFAGHSGLPGQKVKENNDPSGIGLSLPLGPAFSRFQPYLAQVRPCPGMQNDVPRHRAFISATNSSMSKGTAGPDANPSSTSACMSAIALRRS